MKKKEIETEKQKGFSLVSVVFSILLLSTIGLTLSPLLSNRAFSSVNDLQAQQAFYVASGGLNYVLAQEFMDSSDFTTANPVTNKSLGLGQFSATYSNVTATSADITVTGQVTIPGGGTSIRIIRQSCSKGGGGGSGIASGGGNIQMIGSGTINGDLEAEGNVELTPGFTVNGDITDNTNLPQIPVDAAQAVTDIANAAPLTIPGDFVVPLLFTGYIRVTGNVTIPDGSLITGTIVSDSNILLSGSVNLTGTFAATGNIQGNAIGSSMFQAAGGQTNPVLISGGGNIQFKSNASPTIIGNMTAHGNIQFESDGDAFFTISGIPTANGNFQFNGSVGNLSVSFSSDDDLVLTNWREI